MKPTWNDPERDSTQPDPELEALARLYREHPPAEPSPDAWQSTLARVHARLDRPNRSRWRLPFFAGLIAAAAATVGGVVLARNLWPTPARAPEPDRIAARPVADDEEPFPVAALSEINIIRMDPNDAERVVMGQPLIGSLEFVSTEDIDIVQVDPCPETERMPHLQRNTGGPMIIIARADEDEEP